MEQCNASLKRLNTDYVDIFYCHRYDAETPLDETLRALDDLVRQGKVLYIGISEWNERQILDGVYTAKQLNLNPIAVNQPSYSMLNRYIEDGVMQTCNREGIGLAVFSPLAQGVLTGKYKKGQIPPKGSRAADEKTSSHIARYISDENLEKVEKLKPIADRQGLSLAELALIWILQHKEISSVIIGASKPDQIDINVKAAGVGLDESTMVEINNILSS